MNPDSASGTFTTVAFVELPDEALDLFSRLAQRSGSQVLLVVGADQDSYAMRMAEVLHIPTLDYPNRLSLISCDTIIVGPFPEGTGQQIREMMEGTDCRVFSLDEALRYLGMPSPEFDGPLSDSMILNVGDLSVLFAEEERRLEENRTNAKDPGTESESAPPAKLKNPPRRREMDIRQPGETHTGPARVTEPDAETSEAEPRGSIEADSPLPAGPGSDTSRPTASRESIPEGFDPGPLLGEDLREQLGSLNFDGSGRQVLERLLDTVLHATKCQTGSIMLPDADREHLRIVVAKGIPDDVAQSIRQKIDEGVAGEVFREGRPRLLRGRTRNPDADIHLRPQLREAAVIPIQHEGNSIGVLCVNQETDQSVLNDASLTLLERFAKEVSAGIFKALRLDTLEDDPRMEALLRQAERLMALDESLSHRLIAVSEAVKKAIGAELAHVFVVDPLGQRLEMITPRRGTTGPRPEYTSMDEGLYGWVARRGSPRALPLWDEAENAGVVTYMIPIQTDVPRGLLVFENAPLATRDTEPQLNALQEVMVRVTEIIEVEKNLEAQELLSQLELRIADQSSRFAGLLPRERARTVLEFAVELLAGETAAWIPKPGAPAVWSRPTGPKNAAIQGRYKTGLDDIARWVGERPEAAAGSKMAGWDADAPGGGTPYLCVRGAQDDLFLLAFPVEETMGTLAQIPISILYTLMRRLAGFLPEDLAGPASSKEHVA